MANRRGKSGNSDRFYLLGLQNQCRWWLHHEIKRCLLLGRKAMTNLESILKSREITLLIKAHIVKTMVFSSSYVQIWELDHKEDWALKYWYFWIVWCWRRESLLDCKEIKPVNTQGNQPWIFIRNTDAETEALILWPLDAKWWLPGKRLWCLERLKAKWEVGGRGWDGWVASPTHWTWIWANSGR